MYDYNKLSRAEQKMLVELRRYREFPLHEPPRSFNIGLFLITSACFQHRNIFSDKTNLHWLCCTFLKDLEEQGFSPMAWVFLPNHYHLLIPIHDMKSFSECIRKLHSKISSCLNRNEKKVGKRIWYSFSDRRIRSDRHRESTVHYIHQNPVKHGGAENLEQWPWSSIHEYIERIGIDRLMIDAGRFDFSNYGTGWDF